MVYEWPVVEISLSIGKNLIRSSHLYADSHF
jgi:hypothetical protein